jgi:hypothetical protein
MIPSPSMHPLLAHQGGWDELMWFSVPVLLMLTWVRWAEKRAKLRKSEAKGTPTNMPDEPDH